MSQSKRWVPTFPGETRLWERAVTSVAAGVFAFFGLHPIQGVTTLVGFAMLFLVGGLSVLASSRDRRYFGRGPRATKGLITISLSTLAILAILLWVFSSLPYGVVEWAVLAGVLMAGAVFLLLLGCQFALRQEGERHAFAPAGSPETAQR